MHDQQLSVLEISRIVEQAMLPLRCSCTSTDGLTLRIQVSSPGTLEQPLTPVLVSMAELNSSRALSRLVRELREEAQRVQPRSSAALVKAG